MIAGQLVQEQKVRIILLKRMNPKTSDICFTNLC